MSSGDQKLLADYEQIKQLLAQYSNIRIIDTEGDPPEQYDIEYTLKGYKTNIDGSAVPVNTHQIRITLPFGYPHFPPTAKPLSSIFHPDIDPDAIRIADFWQNNKSLADLILHIGEMICGKHVSTSEPFNQAAADWYEERQGWLPFDTLEPDDEDEEQDDDAIDLTEAQEAEAAPVKPTGSTEPKSRSGKPLDILQEDFNFDFDDEELLGLGRNTGKEDDTAVSTDEDIQEEFDLTEEITDGEDDISLDFNLENEADETVDLTEEIEGLFASDEEKAPADFEIEEEADDLTSIDSEGSSPDLEIEKEMDSLISLDSEDTDLDFQLEEEVDSSAEPVDTEEADHADDDAINFKLEVEDEPAQGTEPEETTFDGLQTEDEFTGFDDESPGGPAPTDEQLTDQELDDADAAAMELEEELSELDDESLSGLDLSEDEPPAIPEENRSGGEAGSIKPLIEKKEIFAAKKVLADIPDTGSIPEFKKLEKDIAEAVSEAEELYKKADALEQKGELEKAGLMLDLVANIAIDYPGLEFARNRIRESMIAGGGKKDEEVDDEAQVKKSRRLKVRIPYTLIASVLVVVGLAGGAAGIYFRDTESINAASKNFAQAEKLIEKKEYKNADQSLKKSLTALDNILFLKQDKKELLQQKIDTIYSSKSFQEGLQGKVLYDGKYVTVEMAKDIDKFTALKNSAELQKNSNNIDKAIKLYEQAIPAAEKIGFDEEVQTITQTIYSLRLNKALEQARKAEDEKEWKQAADTYAKALELSKNLSTSDNKNEIATRLASASFRHELDQSKRAFTASEWEKTIEMLQRALNILEENPDIAQEDEKAELNQLLVNSQLYHMLSKAKKAFEMKEWELAITEYENAIDLLESNSDILEEEGEDILDSVHKIQKTILMTKIAREQDLSTSTINNNDLEATRGHYLAIASLIETSPFKSDETLKKILDNARQQSAALEKEIVINKRIDWLMENYQEIFTENYPSAQHSKLLKPKVTFIRKEENRLIFNMSCVEKKQGRSFRLELNYEYDMDTDKWAIYSGKL